MKDIRFKHTLLMLWNAYLILLLPTGLIFVVPMLLSAYHAFKVIRLVFQVGIDPNKG